MADWTQVNLLEMLVSKSELNLETNKENDFLFFSCDLLNIARGRCDLIFKKQSLSDKNIIYISMKKPVMEGTLHLSEKKFEGILNNINKLSIINNKRLKIIIKLDKPLAVNNHGLLSLDQDIELEITELRLILPII